MKTTLGKIRVIEKKERNRAKSRGKKVLEKNLEQSKAFESKDIKK